MNGLNKLGCGMALAGTLALCVPAAQAADLGISFEELSPNTLSCTGACSIVSSIDNLGPDHWRINWAVGVSLFNVGETFAWTEPEPGFYNTAFLDMGFADVRSDVAAADVVQFGGNFCNPVGAGATCLVAVDTANAYFMTIRDAADEVPEPATLALLGLGIAGFRLARRKAA